METENMPQTNKEQTTTLINVENVENLENLEGQEKPEGSEASENSDHSDTPAIPDEPETSDNTENPECQNVPESPNDAEEANHLPTQEDRSEAFVMPTRAEDISEEDYLAAATLVSAIERELAAGAISGETLALLLKSVAYDRAIVTARHDGEVAGRNQRIDEYLQERRSEKSLPDLGRSPVNPHPTLPFTVIGGLSAADRKTIWERGNEKRHKR